MYRRTFIRIILYLKIRKQLNDLGRQCVTKCMNATVVAVTVMATTTKR